MSSLKSRKRTYHHGALPTALIESGLELLEARDAEGLGLRELARSVGVSASSVYRHFPSKEALLQALAAEGLRRLAESQKAASSRAGGGMSGFAATGRAYVAFALKKPALFRLIFSGAALSPAEDASQKEDEASILLKDFAAEIVGEPGSEAARIVASQAWALVHGLTVLILDRRLPNDSAMIAKVIGRYVDQLRSTPTD